MSAQAKSNAKPVDLGTKDFPRIARLLWASGNALSAYRSCPNYPMMQSAKAASWNEYQACLAELMEAIHG